MTKTRDFTFNWIFLINETKKYVTRHSPGRVILKKNVLGYCLSNLIKTKQTIQQIHKTSRIEICSYNYVFFFSFFSENCKKAGSLNLEQH